MEKYKCKKEFELPMCDEDGNPSDDYHKVHKGSIYEYQPDYRGESEVRMYLEDGDDDFGYIDITFEYLEKYFERIA